jgi:GxxExxY protein
MDNIIRINTITGSIIGSAIDIHRLHGPGLLESAYEACMVEELTRKGHNVEQQVLCPLKHRGKVLNKAYRIDLLVDELVIVEIKAVEHILYAHRAQILHYMYLSDIEVGLLINFRKRMLVNGVKRYRLWEAQREAARLARAEGKFKPEGQDSIDNHPDTPPDIDTPWSNSPPP